MEPGMMLLLQQGVAGIGGVVHNLFIDEPLALQVHHQIRLPHGLGEGFEYVCRTRGIVGNLHIDLRLFRADLPGHIQAVDSRNAEGKHIPAPFPSHILADHIHIVSDTAGRHNDRIAEAFDFHHAEFAGPDAFRIRVGTDMGNIDSGLQRGFQDRGPFFRRYRNSVNGYRYSQRTSPFSFLLSDCRKKEGILYRLTPLPRSC